MPRLFQSVVYLQIRRQWLSVRVLSWSGGDFRWEGPAEGFVTADSKGRKVVISCEAARLNPTLLGRRIQAFAHPRTIIDGFEDTATLLDFALRESGYKTRSKKLMFVLHVRDEWEGGLSDVEQRSLLDLCRKCGAAEVRCVDQPFELTPPQVLEVARAKPVRS